MRYSENELKALSYPLGEKEIESCIAALEIVVSECKVKGYKANGSVRGGSDGANYVCELAKAGELLKIMLVGAYGENTVGVKNSPVSIAVLTQSKAAAEELKEALENSYKAQGAAINSCGTITLANCPKGFRTLIGYVEGDCCNILGKSGIAKRYLELNLQEMKRKHKATDYCFKKMVRIFRAVAAEMLKAGVPEAKGICPVKLGNILCVLPDSEYQRFDELTTKLEYLVLKIGTLLEKESALMEANGKQALFATAEEQDKYANFFAAMGKWLQ